MRTLLLLLLLPAVAFAQGTKADYERSLSLNQRFGGKVFRDRVEPTWAEDGKRMWYAVALPDGKKEFVLVDIEKGTREVVTEDKLPKGGVEPKEPKKKGVALSPSPPTPLSPEEGGTDDPDPEPELVLLQRQPRGGGTSPDGKWVAGIKDYNVVLRAADGKDETALSSDGKADDRYGRLFWSPDSTRLVALKTKAGGDRKVTLVETSPKDQLQPKTSTYDYLKPGDPIPLTKPKLFDIAAKKPIPVSDDLFPTPWAITDEHWSKDGKRFLFAYNQRGHTVMRVDRKSVV